MNTQDDIPTHVVKSFTVWSNRFGKNYSTPSELSYRLSVFHSNYIKVRDHNQSKSTYTMELNHFADMTPEEFKSKMLGFKPNTAPNKKVAPVTPYVGLPESVDWRKKGIVNPIKNQGHCGSCWAFSTVQALESKIAQEKGTLKSFAEQQLVDCAKPYGTYGCNGGLMDSGFKYIMDHGIELESQYPYTARDGTCKAKGTPAATMKSFVDVPKQSMNALKTAVSQQVLAIACDAQHWPFYKSGIFSSSDCGLTLDHGIGLIGYGSDNGKDYWLIRNSWGPGWGEEGYIRLEKQTAQESGAGTCGIRLCASYPTL